MAKWLQSIECEADVQAFRDGSVDGPLLLQLTAEARGAIRR